MVNKPLLLIAFAISFSFLSAQNTSGELIAPDGKRYVYDLQGNPDAANPNAIIGTGLDDCSGTPGWISYALTHQLSRDRKLLAACETITGKSGLCSVMGELVQGTGYYFDCRPEGQWDMKYSGGNEIYQLHVDTENGNIYVAEIQMSSGNVLEVHTHIPTKEYKWFEEVQEDSYEQPVGFGVKSCGTPPQPPQPPVPPSTPTSPPIAKITVENTVGVVPFRLTLDGSESTDQDEGGNAVVSYIWAWGKDEIGRGAVITRVFDEPGVYEISLTVTDNELEVGRAFQTITVNPKPQEPVVVVPPDTCWYMVYTIQTCGGVTDTIERTPIRVSCPGPPEPKVLVKDCCCEQVIIGPDSSKKSRLQLAGGPVFQRFRGQLTEYGMGLDAQIRYRLGEKRKFALLLDAQVYPNKKATPLDDRPHKWSPLHDQNDPATGLPLVWHRGASRGTGSVGLGLEFAPWKWIFIQGMGGYERTWNQQEISSPEKDPSNQFLGYDLNTWYLEGRIGLRAEHLEIFFSGAMSDENRPFTLIPENSLGGSHHRSLDKILNGGVLLFF